MKVATIGDLHGKTIWKSLVYGYDPDTNTGSKYHIDQFDKIVFIGDYVDDYHVTNDVIRINLLQIIEAKKRYPDKIILLIGNHDQQYIDDHERYRCSGYRPEMKYDLYDIFKENRDLFQLAYQYKNYLWTHAGVHIGWYNDRFKKWINSIKTEKNPKYYAIDFNEYDLESESLTLEFWLNSAYKTTALCIFDVGWTRWGSRPIGGPLWLDKSNGLKKPIPGYHQIVGHSRSDRIVQTKKGKDTSFTCVDCLDKNMDMFYIIDIDNDL